MAILILDAGHGLGNRKAGVSDGGASGNNTNEHAEMEALRTRIVQKLAGRCEILLVPNDGKSLEQKKNYIDDHLKADDVFLSLHMNGSLLSVATGSEVLYDDGHPKNAAEASKIAMSYAEKTGLNNRGAKADTQSHEGNVWILGGAGRRYLVETGFVSNKSDLAVVQTKAEDALVAIIEDLLGIKPVVADPEFTNAWDAMTRAGVFTKFTRHGHMPTTDEIAVMFVRLENARRERRI